MYDEIGLEGQSSAYVCCLDIPVVALNRTQRLEKKGVFSNGTLTVRSIAQRSLNVMLTVRSIVQRSLNEIVAKINCALYFQQERATCGRNFKPHTASLGGA